MKLLSVNVATARPLATKTATGTRTVSSAIGKRSVVAPVAVQPLGLAGDEQADRSVHGGVSKAVYAYPAEHYPFWQTVRAQARVSLWDEPLPPGFMGENLTLSGLLESQVCIGDRLVFPDCELAVSEPRHPCFKFNAVMGFEQAAKMMWSNGWCGFYLQVTQPGTITAGEPFTLVHGPREVGITELFRSRAPR